MHRLLPGVGARRMLILSLLFTALRWLLIGHFPQSLPVLLAAQVLHAASFGTFHAAAIHLVHHYFTGRHQGRGQALYGGVSFGAGGAIGSFGQRSAVVRLGGDLHLQSGRRRLPAGGAGGVALGSGDASRRRTLTYWPMETVDPAWAWKPGVSRITGACRVNWAPACTIRVPSVVMESVAL
jgi:MFS family permease